MEAAEILAALLVLGQQFAYADDPHFGNAEYLASTLTSVGPSFFAAAQSGWVLRPRKRVRFAENPTVTFIDVDEGATLGPTPSAANKGKARPEYNNAYVDAGSYIRAALAIVEALELMTGFGPPHEGDSLKGGAERFAQTQAQLRSAYPDGSWQGGAA